MKILHSKIIGDSNKHVIILHGFLGMGDNWKTHAKKISLEGFTVHLLDLRNHGRSFWDDDFNFDSMADLIGGLNFSIISIALRLFNVVVFVDCGPLMKLINWISKLESSEYSRMMLSVN